MRDTMTSLSRFGTLRILPCRDKSGSCSWNSPTMLRTITYGDRGPHSRQESISTFSTPIIRRPTTQVGRSESRRKAKSRQVSPFCMGDSSCAPLVHHDIRKAMCIESKRQRHIFSPHPIDGGFLRWESRRRMMQYGRSKTYDESMSSQIRTLHRCRLIQDLCSPSLHSMACPSRRRFVSSMLPDTSFGL